MANKTKQNTKNTQETTNDQIRIAPKKIKNYTPISFPAKYHPKAPPTKLILPHINLILNQLYPTQVLTETKEPSTISRVK